MTDETKGENLGTTRFRRREKPFDYATSTSWLEVTNPSAAAQAPLDYADVASFKGKVTTSAVLMQIADIKKASHERRFRAARAPKSLCKGKAIIISREGQNNERKLGL